MNDLVKELTKARALIAIGAAFRKCGPSLSDNRIHPLRSARNAKHPQLAIVARASRPFLAEKIGVSNDLASLRAMMEAE